MNSTGKLGQNRLSAIELSQALSQIGNACRGSAPRTAFSEYKERYQQQGFEGIQSVPTTVKINPRATAPEVVEQILTLSLEHPGWGCIRISEHLKRFGIRVSSPTVQNILIKHNLGTKNERLESLEARYSNSLEQLSNEQIILLEAANPCIRERHHETLCPGQVLAQDTLFLKTFKHLGKLYLQIVIDNYSNYAFGLIHPAKIPGYAVAVLHNDALPFFQERQLTISSIITNRNREYHGGAKHHYELYLMLNDIEHQKLDNQQRPNGFIERFQTIVTNEFLIPASANDKIDSPETLQIEFDSWLTHYNNERPHPRYRNMGQIPIQVIEAYTESSIN